MEAIITNANRGELVCFLVSNLSTPIHVSNIVWGNGQVNSIRANGLDE